MSLGRPVSTRLVIWIIALIGLVVTLLAWPLLERGHVYIGTIVVSVGTSMLSAALVSLVSHGLEVSRDELENLRHVWGIINVYERRDQITNQCRSLLKDATQIDIAAATGRTFLTEHGDRIAERVQEGKASVRLLLPNPTSMSAGDTARLLGLEEGDVAHLVTTYEKWIARIKDRSPKAAASLHYAGERIPTSYLRIDNTVFWGPYLKGLPSQNTFTFELSANSVLGEVLSKNFDLMLSRYGIQFSNVQIVEFMGMPASGKSTIVQAVKEKIKKLRSASNEDVESHEGDTPLTFNQKVRQNLNRSLETMNDCPVLLLDRGINDFRVWLKVHRQLENLSEGETHSLLSELHVPPPGISYLTFVFLQDAEVTLQRRTKPERPVDRKWALHRDTLNVLRGEYERYAATRPTIIPVDAARDLATVRSEVLAKLSHFLRTDQK